MGIVVHNCCVTECGGDKFLGVVGGAGEDPLALVAVKAVNGANGVVCALTNSKPLFATRKSQRCDALRALDTRDIVLRNWHAFLLFVDLHLLDDHVVAADED